MRSSDLGLGRRAFWRRRCPACGRAFRLRPTPGAAAELAGELVRRVPHANAAEIASEGASAGGCLCPYCGRQGPLELFLGRAQESFFDGAAEWIAAEVRFEQLRLAERTLGQNPYLTFLALPPAPPRLPAPAEVNELSAVPLLCCGGGLEIERGWEGDLHCPYCGR